MATIQSDRPTGADATIDWLRERAEVSQSTRSSYRGEANRFCEYLAAHDALLVADITEQHWDEYLRGLMSARKAIGSRRKEVLRQSSALQAARITRSFLLYCYRREWLSWSPGPTPRPCPPKEARPDARPPAALSRIVLESDPTEDEATARRRCAISLTFWAGLKPRELASLRIEGLVVRPDGTGSIHVDGRKAPAECPPELISAILTYRQARMFAQPRALVEVLVPNSPLLTRLRSSNAISARTAWQLVRAWQQDDETEVSTLGAKAVRDSYVALAGADSTYALDQIALQTGRASSLTATGNLPPSAIRIDRVRQRLAQSALSVA